MRAYFHGGFARNPTEYKRSPVDVKPGNSGRRLLVEIRRLRPQADEHGGSSRRGVARLDWLSPRVGVDRRWERAKPGNEQSRRK